MSGRTLAVIGLLLLLVNVVFPEKQVLDVCARWGSRITLVVAGWLLLVAQYETWKEKRDALIVAQETLSAEADMRGTIWYRPLDSRTRYPNFHGAALWLVIDAANYGRKPCEISKVRIKVSRQQGEPFDGTMQLGHTLAAWVSHGERFYLQSEIPPVPDGIEFNLADMSVDDLVNGSVSVTLVDSLGVEYQNTVTKLYPNAL